jgi:hypothetical protein
MLINRIDETIGLGEMTAEYNKQLSQGVIFDAEAGRFINIHEMLIDPVKGLLYGSAIVLNEEEAIAVIVGEELTCSPTTVCRIAPDDGWYNNPQSGAIFFQNRKPNRWARGLNTLSELTASWGSLKKQSLSVQMSPHSVLRSVATLYAVLKDPQVGERNAYELVKRRHSFMCAWHRKYVYFYKAPKMYIYYKNIGIVGQRLQDEIVIFKHAHHLREEIAEHAQTPCTLEAQ